ncbi:hypothetical protein UlMin_033705 [Ulmus minor]
MLNFERKSYLFRLELALNATLGYIRIGLRLAIRTFLIRSRLLAPVHSFATDDTRGIFLWWFFLLMTGISMILCCQMKQQALVYRT